MLTGGGIEDIRICKKAIVMPWQRVCLPLPRGSVIPPHLTSAPLSTVRKDLGGAVRLLAQPSGDDDRETPIFPPSGVHDRA